MLRLSVAPASQTPRSTVRCSDNMLRVEVVNAPKSAGIVTIKGWTLEISSKGEILVVDRWTPTLLQPRAPAFLRVDPIVSIVLAQPDYDVNQHATYQYETEKMYYEPDSGTLACLWTDCVVCALHKWADNLTAVVINDEYLGGLLIHGIP